MCNSLNISCKLTSVIWYSNLLFCFHIKSPITPTSLVSIMNNDWNIDFQSSFHVSHNNSFIISTSFRLFNEMKQITKLSHYNFEHILSIKSAAVELSKPELCREFKLVLFNVTYSYPLLKQPFLRAIKVNSISDGVITDRNRGVMMPFHKKGKKLIISCYYPFFPL